MADEPTNHWNVPWDTVMKPLADSNLWLDIRRVASLILEDRYEGTGFGISSSDVNHTIFGTAKFVWLNPDNYTGSDFPGKVLIALVHERGGE